MQFVQSVQSKQYTIENSKSGKVHSYWPMGTTDGEPDGGPVGRTRCGLEIYDQEGQWELGEGTVTCKNCRFPGHGNLDDKEELWW